MADRILRLADAEMGPTQRADPRGRTLARMIALLDGASDVGARLVVFPELAFTTFFPCWLLSDAKLDAFFEAAMPGPQTVALFDRARAHGVAIWVGYAERTAAGDRFNSAILAGPDGTPLLHTRKVHLPGTVEPRAGARLQRLEKRYFAYGDRGVPVVRTAALGGAVIGAMICNNRRGPEAWRVLGLGGAKLVLLGYNSAAYDPNGGEDEDATVVGVLVEVPVMPSVVRLVRASRGWYEAGARA